MNIFAKFLLVAVCVFFSTTGFALSGEGARCPQTEEAVKNATYGHIDAKGLKVLMDVATPLTILDARGHKWHDGSKIPGAILASYGFSEEELRAIIPDENALVVVYCFSFSCPLSRYLVDKLVELGYQNVLEYPGGLGEWRDVAGYPIEAIEN